MFRFGMATPEHLHVSLCLPSTWTEDVVGDLTDKMSSVQSPYVESNSNWYKLHGLKLGSARKN